MSKLHELLAVEGNLETQAVKVRNDLINTFEKKRHLFEEKRVVFQPNTEGAPAVTESQSDIQSTVEKELGWIGGHIAKALDASYQVAEANTVARGDVVLEEEGEPVLLKGLPATALLELEKRVGEIHQLLNAIPTLDPAKGFKQDAQRGEGIYLAREVVKERTKKATKVIVKYEATKEHPAQTEMVTVDAPVGNIREQEWSALMTPADKAALIERVEILLRAVKRGRSRANDQEVDQSKKIGRVLLDYVFNGKVK